MQAVKIPKTRRSERACAAAIAKNGRFAAAAINRAFDDVVALANSERVRLLAAVTARITSLQTAEEMDHARDELMGGAVSEAYLASVNRVNASVLNRATSLRTAAAAAGSIPFDREGVKALPDAPNVVECQAIAGIVAEVVQVRVCVQ